MLWMILWHYENIMILSERWFCKSTSLFNKENTNNYISLKYEVCSESIESYFIRNKTIMIWYYFKNLNNFILLLTK